MMVNFSNYLKNNRDKYDIEEEVEINYKRGANLDETLKTVKEVK